ncbi:zeta toxin [Kribbella sp. VKM Ac-2571]|uniref:zeta toxin family protein n=1 Tax=Kribbella sp. VKM Ac-2571 TaxID=2512222 RepID=UPI00105EE803|nr:zeta toxin family protein [Kribbella sp. VKM Ac-2571]TDO68139.1 zeta toxin [Kribbella sp. VKM Ac-2571]
MTAPWGPAATSDDQHLLDEAESARIFRERIVPDQLSGVPQEQPIVMFVGGQPGDGKASITALAKAVLQRRGRPLVLSALTYEPYHPDFYEPITDVPPAAWRHVAADGRRWLALAEELVIRERYDAIVETELADPDAFAESAQRFKAAGYQVEVALLAVPEARSRLGILERHIRSLEKFGFGRFVEQSAHDAGYVGVLRAAELVDTGQWADRVGVLRADGELVYGNQRDGNAAWQQPARTADAITWERDRAWTVLESRYFLESVAQVEPLGLVAPVQWIRDEAVEGVRAVTAMGRPRVHPDAVTLHIAKAGTAF